MPLSRPNIDHLENVENSDKLYFNFILLHLLVSSSAMIEMD